MARVLVSAATGVLNPVLRKLDSLLGKEYKLLMGVHGEIMFMKAELEHMHAFLERMSWVEDPNEQAKLWMKDVRELSYDIEDSIDEFILRIDNVSAEPNCIRGYIERIVNLLTGIKTRLWIAGEIQGLQTRIKEASDRRERYKIDDKISRPSNMTIDPRVCALYKNVAELVGIDGPRNELIKLLTEGEGVAAQQLRVVSIVGIGGLGKTTVAKQVYDTLGQQFEHRAFVSVSRNPHVTRILNSIRVQLNLKEGGPSQAQKKRKMDHQSDGEHLINFLSELLKANRCFIVVDDIWSVQTWNIIKCVFTNGGCGSRIITTTRINEVAEACCPSQGDYVYKLSPLSVVDSKRLFLNRIFGSEGQCPSHLSKISDKILTKCGGLPLAIVALSGLLANKAQTMDQWDQVQNSIGNSLERNIDVQGMMGVLSLSYFDLPCILKTCLLYLSIFPEDYAIEKKRLVRRWIAEGFILEEHGQTLYELGERCFNELINRSLLQPGETSKFGEVKTCRVHDTILDFIVSKSIEENFVTILSVPNVALDPENKVRRFSLQDRSEDTLEEEEDTSEKDIIPAHRFFIPRRSIRRIALRANREAVKIPENLISSHVRSLTVFCSYVKLPSFLKFRLLRVLDLEGCGIENRDHLADIGKIHHLKYLSLKNTYIRELPEQIAELQYLETLNVKVRCNMKIPRTISRLGRLVQLILPWGTKLPDEIGDMQALQVLQSIDPFVQSINFVQELGRVTNLRKLSIAAYSGSADKAESSKGYMKEMISSICKLGRANLHSLCIHISHDLEDHVVQDSWCPAPRSLRKLVIKRANVKDLRKKSAYISRVPRWIGSLVNLQKLVFPMKSVGQEDVGILGGLPALLYLFLPFLSEEGRVVAGPDGGRLRISGSHGFPSLRHFHIGGCRCAFGLIFEAGSMPKLQRLELEFNANLTNSLTNGDFDFGINHLSSVTSIYCRVVYVGATKETFEAVETAMERAIGSHPNHPIFTSCSHPTKSQMMRRIQQGIEYRRGGTCNGRTSGGREGT